MKNNFKIHIWLLPFIGLLFIKYTTHAQSASERMEAATRLLEQGQFKAALEAAKLARALTGRDSSEIAKVTLLLSKCFNEVLQRDSAIANSQYVITLLESSKNDIYYEALIQLGFSLNSKRRFEEALTVLQAAANYFEADSKKFKPAAEARLGLGFWHLLQGHFQEAYFEFQTTLQHTGTRILPDAGQANNYAGYALWQLGKYEKAITYFQQGEKIFTELGGAEHNYYGVLKVNMGACYDNMGLFRKAVDCYEKALTNFLIQSSSHPYLVNVYNNLGRSYKNLGEYTSAARFLEKALAIQPKNGRYWNNLGDAYQGMGDSGKAEASFNKALDILLNIAQLDSINIARPYHNLATIYRERGLIDKALEYEFRSLPFRKSGSVRELDIAHTYSGIGACYVLLKDYQKALVYYDSALVAAQSLVPSGLHNYIAEIYTDKAACLMELQNYSTAASLLDRALASTGFQNQDLKEVLSPLTFLDVLQTKGTLSRRLFEKDKKPQELQTASETYQLAAQAIQHFRNDLLEDQSKATVAGQYREILAEGLEVAYLQHQLQPQDAEPFQRAFALAEQGKSLLLLEGLRESGAVQFAGLPDALLTEEQRWQQNISDTEIRLHHLQPSDTAYATILKDSLFLYQRDYETFKKSMAREYPAYYNFKYDLSFATVEQLQQNLLQPNQTLLEYFVSDSSIVAFVIQRDRKEIVQLKKDFPLEDWIQQLQEGLYGYYSTAKKTDALYEKTVRAYATAAQQLYQKLIAPLQSKLTNQVLIVPDGALGYVPFEALLSAAPKDLANFSTYPFLLQNYQIQYCYSSTLLREMMQKQHRRKPSKSLLAMAPFYKGTRQDLETQSALALEKIKLEVGEDALADRKSFKPLPNSGEEAYIAGELWKGDYFIHTAATKQQFLKTAADYRILHLSTHGVADNRVGDYSYLAFVNAQDSTELLYVRDLYNISLNADLVVLSACETATGELQRGEGIISLARAFAYAGAKSLLTTLWIANDASTKDLMKIFHTQLRKGDSKDKALQTAKLRYLEANKGERAHPFFWAGFVGVGDGRKLK